MVAALTPRIDKLDLTNVRSSDGTGGSVTLLSSDNRIQIFNLSVAKTCVLPSTNIVKGEKWVIKKADATAKLTIACPSAASSSSAYIPSSVNICFLDSKFAYAEFIALQDNPTTPDHWDMNFRFIEKEYLAGNTYNSIALTVTGSTYSLVRGVFVPIQLFDGTWRLRYNFLGTVTSSSRTGYTMTVSGILFKNVTDFYQPVPLFIGGGTINWIGWAQQNTATVTCVHTSNTTTHYGASGDSELDSKPTWAY